MNFLNGLLTPFHARRHARAGVDGKDRYITKTIGLPPADVVKPSYEYRFAVQQAADVGRLEELREDLRRAQDLQAIVGTPGPYTAGLVVVWGLEAASSFLIMRALGIPSELRPLPALALTLAMIKLTKATVAATSTPRIPHAPSVPPSVDDDSGLPPLAPASAPIQWRRYLLMGAYGCLVAAVAAARVTGSDADDVPALLALVEAIIVVGISAGPAFAAVWLEEKRAPAVELARRITLIRRRLRGEERRIQAADRFLRRVDRDQVRWTQDNAALRAAFSTEHELTIAEVRRDADDAIDVTDDTNASTER